jgi:hypothetical protein
MPKFPDTRLDTQDMDTCLYLGVFCGPKVARIPCQNVRDTPLDTLIRVACSCPCNYAKTQQLNPLACERYCMSPVNAGIQTPRNSLAFITLSDIMYMMSQDCMLTEMNNLQDIWAYHMLMLIVVMSLILILMMHRSFMFVMPEEVRAVQPSATSTTFKEWHSARTATTVVDDKAPNLSYPR